MSDKEPSIFDMVKVFVDTHGNHKGTDEDIRARARANHIPANTFSIDHAIARKTYTKFLLREDKELDFMTWQKAQQEDAE